jgi:cell division protein FtsB
MKKSTALSVLAVVIVLLVFSAWLANTVNTQYISYQTQITDLQSQVNELETQIGQLQNQTSSLESQNSKLMIQLGDLTKQLALERHLKVDIVSMSHDPGWYPYGGVTVMVGWNVTVRNKDVVTLSGLEISVMTYYGLIPYGGGSPIAYKVDLLNAGEERVVSGIVLVPLDHPSNLTYVATLKSADRVLDTFTLQP